MANPLFDRVRPAELAGRGQNIEFKGEIANFGRLVEIVEAELAAVSEELRPREWRTAPVDIRLDFGWVDTAGRMPAVTGRVSARVPAVCQRCLGAFELSLEAPVRMLLVRPDAESGDSADLAGYEVWELDEDTLRPLDIVEESLVMTMPLAPVHESEDSCGALAEVVAADGPDTLRPFADLRLRMEESNK